MQGLFFMIVKYFLPWAAWAGSTKGLSGTHPVRITGNSQKNHRATLHLARYLLETAFAFRPISVCMGCLKLRGT